MKINFNFSTITEVAEQSFQLVMLAAAVAVVNYFIGDESGIVAILSVGIFFVSQLIRLVNLAIRLQPALQEIQSALPSLNVAREDIESVEALADYIDESLDTIEHKYELEIAGYKNAIEAQAIAHKGKIEALQMELAERDIDLEQAKLELKKAWKEKTDLDNSRVGEIQRLKERIQNLESKNVESGMKIQSLESAMREYKELDVFLGDDFEAIRKKYQSIINTLNAKNNKKNKEKEVELVS